MLPWWTGGLRRSVPLAPSVLLRCSILEEAEEAPGLKGGAGAEVFILSNSSLLILRAEGPGPSRGAGAAT